VSPRRFPSGQESAPQSTLSRKPIPEPAAASWATTATAPLSASTVSGVRERLTEPGSTAPRSPVLPFRAAPAAPADEVRTRGAIAPSETVELKPTLTAKPKPKPVPELEPIKTRTWPLAVAVASVVVMLLVTAVQVAVELRSQAAATVSVSVPPLPAARLAVPLLSSAPLPVVPSAAPALPSAPPAASAARVLPRAPVVRRRPSRSDVVDPWGE